MNDQMRRRAGIHLVDPQRELEEEFSDGSADPMSRIVTWLRSASPEKIEAFKAAIDADMLASPGEGE